MRRTLFDEDHESFRRMIREFIEREVTPHYDEWFADGQVDRDLYRKLGELGVFGISVPEEYGGEGITSYKYKAILMEETVRAGVTLGTAGVHTDLGLPYLLLLGTDEQKKRWLPKFITGDEMYALAMTEPGTGSDLAGMRTTAKRSEDGSHYVLNGSKTFITGGVLADRVIVCARTSPLDESNRRHGISLFNVDAKAKGYEVGRKLQKIGLRTSDTAELAFTDVIVPAEDLMGTEGEGFGYLAHNLPLERLTIAYAAYCQAKTAVQLALEYVKERRVFGQSVASFQNTKFELAACQARVEAVEGLVDRAVEAYDAGELTAVDAAKAKLVATDAADDVIDRCLQLHGGYGYMLEYPIAQLYTDSRVNRIYGGTSEVMKMIIAKDMGL